MDEAMPTETEELSMRVIESLAAVLETDPLELEPPLFSVIDPTALDRLFRPETTGRVVFEYGEHTVEVTSDGTVSIDGVHAEEYDTRQRERG